MATRTFNFTFRRASVLADVTSVTVAAKRASDDVEVLAATAMLKTATGTYALTSGDVFTPGVRYISTFEYTTGGRTHSFEDDFTQIDATSQPTVASDFDLLCDDVIEQLAVPLTLRKVVVGAMNTTTGVRAETTTDYSVRMVRHTQTQGARTGRGRVPKDAVRYHVCASDISGEEPAEGWRVIDGDDTFQIASVDRSVDRRFWECEARRVPN